jgi:S1-C subfamily serine protease
MADGRPVANRALGMVMAPSVLAAAKRAQASLAEVDVQTTDRATRRGFGVVFRSDGYVLTTARVVDRARSLRARLADGSVHAAHLVGVDSDTDVAVVKVDGAQLEAPQFGSSAALQAGEMALAVAPANRRRRVSWATVCRVTGTHRRVRVDDSRYLLDMIQTDAPHTGSGMSGMALLDSTGSVVGIRNTMSTDGDGDTTMLATPIELARATGEELARDGTVRRAWLGIEGWDLDADDAKPLGVTGGAVVGAVVPDGPASKAGIQGRDVIVGIDGRAVDGMSALVVALRMHRPGDAVTLDVARDTTRQAVRVTLGERH